MFRLPTVSVVVPAYNEENTIKETLQSLLDLDYPKNKLEIIVVNDGSTDKTKEIVQQFPCVTYLERSHSGMKAAALNTGLAMATGELFSCLDADSHVKRDALKKAVQHFVNPRVGGVICAIKVSHPHGFLLKLQRFEYIMSVLIRKLLARVHSLFITPGVLSLYRTALIRELGGFDESTLTEDFEMALRLHKHHYDIAIETQSVGYTLAPSTLRGLVRQRIRWFRGFISNTFAYRSMFFNNEYGMLGNFQLPVSVLSVVMLLITASIVGAKLFKKIFYSLWDFLNLGLDYFRLFEFPTFHTLLSFDYFLVFPTLMGLILVFFFFLRAHRENHEHVQHPFTFLFYLIYYSFMLAFCWTTAVIQESVKAKKRW